MIKTVTLSKSQKLTAAQRREIHNAARNPIVFDEDSPKLTPKAEAAFKQAVAKRNAELLKKSCV